MSKPQKPTFGTNAVIPSSKASQLADLAEYGANPPACIAARAAVFSLVNSLETLVPFDTEVFDNAAMFAPTSTTVTITDAGVYQVSAWVDVAANSTGIRSLVLFQNGAVVTSEAGNAPSSFDARISVAAGALCLPGDTFTIGAFQNSGSAQNITARLSVIRTSGT